jgi:hypothetical protein
VRTQDRENIERRAQEHGDDRAAAAAYLASPNAAPLFRYLERLWNHRGVGDDPQKTAYRVAFRDALEQLKDIRTEGENART